MHIKLLLWVKITLLLPHSPRSTVHDLLGFRTRDTPRTTTQQHDKTTTVSPALGPSSGGGSNTSLLRHVPVHRGSGRIDLGPGQPTHPGIRLSEIDLLDRAVEECHLNLHRVLTGICMTAPIARGYIPLGIAYGILVMS